MQVEDCENFKCEQIATQPDTKALLKKKIDFVDTFFTFFNVARCQTKSV